MAAYKKNYQKKSNIPKKNQLGIYGVIPLILIVAIVPLIIYIKSTKLNPAEYFIMGDYADAQTDIFSYYKMFWFLVFTVASFIAAMFTHNSDLFEKEKKTYYIPAGILAFMILISSAASEYRSTAFFGFYGRYEGAFVLIAYIIVMFAAMNVLEEDKYIKMFFICLISSAAVISILGALQLFGIDYFKSDILKDLITPAELKRPGGMESNFGMGTIFSTLYNPDYVGSYTAMLMPIIIIAIVYLKKISYKLILAVILCLVTLNWIGCDSFAGIIGGSGAIIIILIMFRMKILQHRVIALSIIALLCGGLVIMNLSNGSIINRLKGAIQLFENNGGTESQKALAKILQGLVDVSIDREKAKITTDKGVFIVGLSEGEIIISDSDNKEIPTNISGSKTINILDSRFQNIKLELTPDEGLIEVYYNGYNLIGVLLTKEGLGSSSNRWMTLREGKSIETFGFKGYEAFATNRGYIWSRTIPLIKNSMLLGYGPDTYPIYFPQYDYMGKLRYYETGNIFIDKAHNLYFQTIMNSGVISLLALIALFGIYAVNSIRIYIKEKFESFLSFAGLACFTAFIGYALTGLANDSVISVAPVFWVLLGLGIGTNLKLMKRKQYNLIFDKTLKKPSSMIKLTQ